MAKRNASVCASIPEELITEAIERAMIDALDDDKKMALVNAIVKAALREKTKDYGDETVFGKQLNQMIRERAAKTFETWMLKKSSVISAAIKKQLDTKQSNIIDEMVAAISNDAGNMLQVRVNLHLDRHDE